MDPTLIPSTGGMLGTIAATAMALWFFLDKFKDMRSGDSQRVKALTEDNARQLNRAIDAEKEAADERARADKATEDRNNMIRELSDIKSQFAETNERLKWIVLQNEQLTKQNEQLINQVNQLLKRGTST